MALARSINSFSDNYYTSSIAVYRNRAYLALPRSSCFNNVTQPTLIEVLWNGDRQYSLSERKTYFPQEDAQIWGKCNCLQDAISLDIEVKKSRLWILDRGTEKCPPKVMVYNLFNNALIYMNSFNHDKSIELSCMVVDSNGLHDTRAYISTSSDKIIVLSIKSETWWFIHVRQPDGGSFPMSINRLALSKTRSELFITEDQTAVIAILNITSIQNVRNKVQYLTTTFVGEKLGPSTGIATDMGNGLNYYSVRDFAILRWDTRKPLIAENHDVLMQSYEKMPYISHLFGTTQNEIWALINLASPNNCSNKSHIGMKDNTLLKRRVIKLSKFTKIGRRGSLMFTTIAD